MSRALTFALGSVAGPGAAKLANLLRTSHQHKSELAGVGGQSVDGSIGNAYYSILDLQRLTAVTIEALWLEATPGTIAKTVAMLTAHQGVVSVAGIGGGSVEVHSREAHTAVLDRVEQATLHVGALGSLSLPEAVALASSLLQTIQATPLGALIGNGATNSEITFGHCGIFVEVRTATVGRCVLANPRQVIEIYPSRQ